MKIRLYVTADDIRLALASLGHPASPDEARVFTAATTFADMLATSEDTPWWHIDVTGNPDGARQAGWPQAVISGHEDDE